MAIIPSSECHASVEIPVIVIGAGACGLTAALSARSAGAEVVVLERNSMPHGNTSLSQGTLCAAGTRAQAAQGIEDSGEAFCSDILAQCGGKTDHHYARAIADESGRTVDWLIEEHDVPLAINTAWRGFGHSRPRLHVVPSRTGAELHGSLMKAASHSGVDLVTDADVTDWFTNDSGYVTGVRFLRPDGAFEDIGCSSLILATGGFGANSAMIDRFVPTMSGVRYCGWEGIDGCGIQGAMQLGGAVTDMSAVQNFGALTEPSGIPFNPEAFVEGAIQVNSSGRRFSNEVEDISGQGDRVARLPDCLTWILYDERIHHRLVHLPEYQHAIALQALRQASSHVELALKTGLPPDVLKETLDHVNSLAGSGTVDPYGRTFGVSSRFEAPLYAVKATCALFHTLGGLVVDCNARVLRAGGAPLPNLFAGGGAARNLAGPTSSGYLPGSGLCVAVTLGRLAGVSAARSLAR